MSFTTHRNPCNGQFAEKGIEMAEIRSIVCCCSSGLVSSVMLEMNLVRVLRDLNISGVKTRHCSLSEIDPDDADLVITSKDIALHLGDFPRVIVLKKLISLGELTQKIKKAFEEESEEFFIE